MPSPEDAPQMEEKNALPGLLCYMAGNAPTPCSVACISAENPLLQLQKKPNFLPPCI